jgi:small conductance mechanosensitive channel
MRWFDARRSRRMFETRTELWRELGLESEVDAMAARRAQGGVLISGALIAGVMVLFSHRHSLFPGLGTPVRIATVASLVILGWALARSLGRGLAPTLFRRLDPGTAGTVGFLIRLICIVLVIVVALRVAGLRADALAVGGAFTAVVLGLAAQQTIGNLFAGIVLQSTRPFRVGERVKLQGGFLAGEIEGTVSSLGLFYVTLVRGADRVMIPNSGLLLMAVIPIQEPERVELRARFPAEVTPEEVQRQLEGAISVPIRYPPRIGLEEVDHDDLVVKIVAAPQLPADGAKLASEILEVVRRDTGRERRGA